MAREFRFVKYHGCGNDFIIKDELDGLKTKDRERSRLAQLLCDRHFQIGADGVIFIERAKGVDGSMRLFEPAGNEADMCGNGIRCVAAFLCEKLGKKKVDVLTRDGVKQISKIGEQFRVNMGPIRTDKGHLKEYYAAREKANGSRPLEVSLKIGPRSIKGYLVNTGEPHLVVRTEDVEAEGVRELGDAINADTARFPKGVNIDWVELKGPREIRVRTYERGVYDETLACGTGGTATAGVALKLGWVKHGPVTVLPRGGCLKIEVAPDGNAYMTGPAVRVFEGKLRAP